MAIVDGRLVVSEAGPVAIASENTIPNPTQDPPHIAVSRDGRYVGFGDEVTVRIFQQADLSEVNSCSGHEKYVIGTVANSNFICTSSYDNTVRIWDIKSGATVHEFRGDEKFEEIAISPDGRFLVGGLHDDTTRVWRLPELAAASGDLTLADQSQLVVGKAIGLLAILQPERDFLDPRLRLENGKTETRMKRKGDGGQYRN